MSEVDPGATKLSLEISNDRFPEVWQSLGDLAIGKDVTISILDRHSNPSDTSDLTLAPESRTTPEFVTWVEDDRFDQKIAIISEENLSIIPAEITDNYGPTVPVRAARAVFRATRSRGQHYNTSDYVHEDANTGKKSLIVDKLSELALRLETGDLIVDRAGIDSKAFLQELSGSLESQ